MLYFHFLKDDEYLLVESFTRRWTVQGPATFVSRPWYRVKRRKAITLGPTDYLHVRNTLTGELRAVRGPDLFFPAATEEVILQGAAIPLEYDEYVHILDTSTGTVRVERGEQIVYLSPTEQMQSQKLNAINIDEDTAVLLRDTRTGQLSLDTEHQSFVPAPHQEIEQVRHRIKLEDHETIVVRDPDGRYVFRTGQDAERAFFLEPYSELVTLRWSSGLHKEERNLKVTHIDSRPKFMWYEFEARTQDNVELVIGITFFWQVMDVQQMVRTTDDTPGDVCSHARSMIIQSVSQVTLEHFLAEFNSIVHRTILENDDPFYTERGVHLHAVEVRSIACKDPETQRILQEIIQETTNRLNRLQQQESTNEIQVKAIEGKIETEERRGQLLELQRAHTRAEGLMQGEAEAERARAFLEGLGDLPQEDRLALFELLRKQDILTALSEGRANLYFTPADVNLSIETRSGGR